MTLSIKTVTGEEFEVTGKNYHTDIHDNNLVHYLDGVSYPDEIVVGVQSTEKVKGE